jgi:putative FmdB family regulatory protein
MPIYECDTCGLRFQQRQPIQDEPLTECPECEGHVQRIVQPVGVVFRGSGFYVTDHRKSGGRASSEGETKATKEKDAVGSGSKDD